MVAAGSLLFPRPLRSPRGGGVGDWFGLFVAIKCIFLKLTKAHSQSNSFSLIDTAFYAAGVFDYFFND